MTSVSTKVKSSLTLLLKGEPSVTKGEETFVAMEEMPFVTIGEAPFVSKASVSKGIGLSTLFLRSGFLVAMAANSSVSFRCGLLIGCGFSSLSGCILLLLLLLYVIPPC